VGVVLLYWVWVGFGGSDKASGSGALDCPKGWNSFDDSVRHFRACLPPALVYYDGAKTTALAEVNQQDDAFANPLMLVNLAWINTWPEHFSTDPLQAPLSLRVQLADASTSFDNCNPRQATAGESGLRACSDRLTLNQNNQPIAAADGFIHIYKALLPTQYVPEGSSGDWDLYVLVDSPNAVWDIQQPVVDQIIASIQTY
jgi:hypothetical protein